MGSQGATAADAAFANIEVLRYCDVSLQSRADKQTCSNTVCPSLASASPMLIIMLDPAS